jgi:polyhydroxybutyrate depolymerase
MARGVTMHRTETLLVMASFIAFFTACEKDSTTDAGTDPEPDVIGDVTPDAGEDPDAVADLPADPGEEGDPVDDTPPAGCEPGTRDGPVGATDNLTSGRGVLYNVRTPPTYEATVAHPLIMVYAPAGGDAPLTERFTGLTSPALAAGFVIAYADHVSPRYEADVRELGTIPGLIADRWCVDESRIYYTGHSDGGSVASLLILYDIASPRPAAIAPSAAGVNSSFLASVTCPAPIPVMVIHATGDTLFPGYGRQAATWWVGCFGCDSSTPTPLPDGCLPYTSCTDEVEVQYCEWAGAHGNWPTHLNASIINFFTRF